MVSIVLFLLILSGGSLFGAVVLNRRFTDCLPLSVGGMMAILYVCGLLSILRAGVWLIIAAAAVLIAASIVHVIRRRDPIAALKRVFTADTVIFFVVILILTICTIGMEATAWDEFSHWMDSVKCMTIIDDLGTSPAADIVFPSYPPGISLIQYLLQKIHLLTGGTAFSEWRSMIAGKIVIVSMMAPLFGRLRRRRITGMFLEIVVLLLLPGMLYDWYFISSLINIK